MAVVAEEAVVMEAVMEVVAEEVTVTEVVDIMMEVMEEVMEEVGVAGLIAEANPVLIIFSKSLNDHPFSQ